MVLASRTETPYYDGARQRTYVRRPEPVHFPSEGPEPGDGVELVPETGRHLLIRTTLFLMMRHALRGRATVASEQFVYWDPTDSTQCIAPDLAVRLGGPWEPIDVWRTWELGAPQVVVEIVSDYDRSERERQRKFQRYQRAGISEVVWFDPQNQTAPIRLFDMFDGDLVERALSDGEALRSDILGFYWTVLDDPTLGLTLRPARDPAGQDLLPTFEEVEHQAREAERQAREVEHQAREAERQAKEAERQAKEAALARVRELEAELARRG